MIGDIENVPQEPGVPAYFASIFRPPEHKHALIIPTINEDDRILQQLKCIHEANYPVDVYIADGGSTDGSTEPERLNKLGVTAILVKNGPGKLSAQLRMAFHHLLTLPYEGFITMDGNGKDDVEGIPRILKALEEGFDFVQGSRFVSGGLAEHTPLPRLLGIRLVHAPVTTLAARRHYTDTTNGFRGHSPRLLSDPKISVFRDIFNTYELLAYLPIRAARLGYRTCEVPVARRYAASTKTPTKIRGITGNFDLLRILANASMKRYDP